MRPRQTLVAIAFLAPLIGCFRAPEPNPPLQPVQPVERWVHGKAYLRQTRGDLEATVAFLEAAPGSLLFDVVLTNRGQAAVLVAPEQFSCGLEELPPGVAGPRDVPAVDPEQMIHRLGQAAATEQAAKANTAVFRGVFLLADMADSVSNDRYRSPRERREVRQDSRETYRDMNEADREADRRSSGIAGMRRHWEEDCVRKTTLDPGYGLQGKVVFHLDTRRVGRVILRLPVGSSTFQFEYRPR
ncbi:MAG: hypothetical protein Q8K67_12810 [Geothrix sp.]|nr:hypothetical protein [Geothrix sp.]